MRKVYRNLLTAMFAVAGCVGLNAQTAYYEPEAEHVVTIEPGQDYVVRSTHYMDENYYINDTEFSSSATDKAIMQFEVVGTADDGSTTYLLKQAKTGLYLENPDVSSDLSTITWTASKARAWVFTAKQAEHHFQSPSQIKEAGGEVDYSTYAYAKEDGTMPEKEGSFVFCRADWKTVQKTWWLCSYQKPQWASQYYDAHTWWVYKATPASAYDNLCYAYNALFGSGQTPESYFKVGDDMGQIDKAIFDAFKAAYDEAVKLYNDDTQADDVYKAAQKTLEDTYAAAKAAIKVPSAGYYVIRNAADNRGDGYASIYDGGATLTWEKFVYDGTQELQTQDARYIWQLIPSADGTGYYLKNYFSSKYIGKQGTLYSQIPTTADPVQIYKIGMASGGAFNIYTTGVNDSYPALHAQADGHGVVIWDMTNPASTWFFNKVSDDELKKIEDGIAQAALNDAAQTLYVDAQVALGKGISVKSDASKDGLYDDLGFITDGSRFFTNAQETSEGEYPAGYPECLVDNDESTYFHSSWSNTAYAGLTHYLGVDLGEAMQYLTLKYSRRNNNGNGTPKTIHVYAVNDTTGTYNGTCPWTDQGYLTFTYPYASNATYTAGEIANFTGLASVALDAPYKYIRLDVEHTMTDATSNGNLFFHLSEMHLYKGEYDPATSLIEAVPAEITAELKKQMAATKAELEAGTVQQSTYDAFEAALKNFNDNLPDPTIVTDLLTEAKSQLEAAEEGEELGYFQAGSKATFETAITAVESSVKPLMTIAEVHTAKDAINAAINAFNKGLNKPANGTLVFIKSATTSDAAGTAAHSYLYAANSDTTQIKWGGYSADNGDDEFISERLNYYWRVIDNGDETYSLRNLGTGNYFGNPVENNAKVNMRLNAENISFRSAKVPGLFNIVCADNVFVNAQPNTNSVVTWNTASGTDNSAIQIVPVSADNWQYTYHIDFEKAAQIVTLPIEVTGLTPNGAFYSVLGLNGSNIELKAYGDNETIPAGTPFVYIPSADAESGATDFTPTAATLDEITTVSSPLSLNGLQGTFHAAKPGAGNGMVYASSVIIATATDLVAANSGWFTDQMPTTTETGGAQLAVDGVINAINTPVAFTNGPVDVYTISGVLLRKNVKAADATKGLSSGLYIIGGKKILVK